MVRSTVSATFSNRMQKKERFHNNQQAKEKNGWQISVSNVFSGQLMQFWMSFSCGSVIQKINWHEPEIV